MTKMGKYVFLSEIVTLIILIVSDVEGNASSRLILNKCCAQDEFLKPSRQGVQCFKIQDSDQVNTTDVWWWIPQTTIQNILVESEHTFHYGFQPKCDIESKEFLRYQDTGDVREFSFHIRDGEIRLDVLKEASFHDTSRGRDDSFPPHTFCMDAGLDETHLAVVCPCDVITCVRLCCFDGQYFDRSQKGCVNLGDNYTSLNDKDFFDWVPRVDKYEDYYRLERRFPKCDKLTHHAMPPSANASQLLLGEDGSLKALDTGDVFTKDAYCGTVNEENNEMVIMCLKTTSEVLVKQVMYGSIFIIGTLCLLATILATAILPEMRRNVQGKAAFAHNAMLFIMYLTSSVSHLHGSHMSSTSCAVLTLIIQYSILSAFFWLNIMCIDIACCCHSKHFAQRNEGKRMIVYSMYAWGASVLISVATIVCEYTPAITVLKPSFGIRNCFFNNKAAELLFFYGPMALVLATNLLLFIYIVIKIRMPDVSFETSDSLSTKRTKYKLVMFVRLFFVMGITWVTEVLSWAVGGPTYLWYVTDLINVLRAVFIFYFFCCKKSIYLKLRHKLLSCGKEVSGVGSRFGTTNSSTLQTMAVTTPGQDRKLMYHMNPHREQPLSNRNTRGEEIEMT